MKLRHFSESPKIHGNLTWNQPNRKIQYTQCLTVRFKLKLRVMSMFGLISKNYHILYKLIFFLQKMAYGLGEDIHCINFLVVNDP